MKTNIIVALLIVLSAGCQSATPIPPLTPAGQVETQVAATISAGQTSTAAVEQAVSLTLTAAVPSPTNTLPPSPTPEPTTAVPPTDTPAPTATKKPVIQATAVSPSPTVSQGPTNTDSIAGNWVGTIIGESDPSFSTPIDLFIQAGCTAGSVCGTVSVPQLPCSGNIALTAINGDTFVFIEQNMGGASFCGSGGFEYVRLRSDGNLSWSFRGISASGENIASNAVLRRP